MAAETMTVHVPELLYARLRERAKQTRRSVEDEVVEALAAAVSSDAAPIDADLDEAALTDLPVETLRDLARASHLTHAAAAYLEELNFKRQREGLSVEEGQIAEALLRQQEQAMLVRAQALALLKERGQEIETLLAPTTQ